MNEKFLYEISKYLHELIDLGHLDHLSYYSKSMKSISLLDLKIMRFINHNDKAILKNIREALKVPNSTLASAIKRLIKNNIISKKRNPEDNRSYIIYLTNHGKEIQKKHRQLDIKIASEFAKALNDENDIKEFIRLLKKIVDNKPNF